MSQNKEIISTLNGLIETLKDGQEGYKQSASGVDDPQLKTLFDTLSLQRSKFAGELQNEVVTMGDPDPVRLDYRTQVRSLVAEVVRAQELPSIEMAARRATNLGVPEQDVGAVAAEAMKDLQGLRPEVLARYALRKSEYDTWAEVVDAARKG